MAVVALVAGSCGRGNTHGDGSPSYDAYGVSFVYPERWRLTADTTAAPFIVELELAGPRGAFCDLAVYGDTADVDRMVQGLLEEFRAEFAGAREARLRPVRSSLAGVEARGVVWVIDTPEGRRMIHILAANVGLRAVTLYWQALARDDDRVGEDIAPIMRALEVEDLPSAHDLHAPAGLSAAVGRGS